LYFFLPPLRRRSRPEPRLTSAASQPPALSLLAATSFPSFAEPAHHRPPLKRPSAILRCRARVPPPRSPAPPPPSSSSSSLRRPPSSKMALAGRSDTGPAIPTLSRPAATVGERKLAFFGSLACSALTSALLCPDRRRSRPDPLQPPPLRSLRWRASFCRQDAGSGATLLDSASSPAIQPSARRTRWLLLKRRESMP
ncbi:hypothetical protein BS78_01G096100, partial [Paspalum vaginatum]